MAYWTIKRSQVTIYSELCWLLVSNVITHQYSGATTIPEAPGSSKCLRTGEDMSF